MLHKIEWVYCPICGNKTRNKFEDDSHRRARRKDAEPMNL